MARFAIAITKRFANPHTPCFEDVAKMVAESLRQLGHETVEFDQHPYRLLVFGGGNISDRARVMPEDAIFFNAEQVSANNDPAMQIGNYKQLRSHVVWDYSQKNIEALHELGIERAVHCPIGYMPSMTRIEPAVEEDIDVLFYGSVNKNRKEILEQFDAAGVKVEWLYGVYGAELDRHIARAKIVLNLHFYRKPIFEMFRVGPLLANKKCVVSEDGSHDLELEDFARRATCLVPRDKIVASCQMLLDPGPGIDGHHIRAVWGEVGFETFAQTNFVENVRRAVEQS